MTRTSVLVAFGWVMFLASLPLVAIDSNMGGELLRGFEVRGYQCFIGAFVAPLALPLATPLWLMLCAGNLATLAAPLVAWWPVLARWARLSLALGAFAACALWFIGTGVGVVRLYEGYYVWCAALVVLATAFWAGRQR